MMIRPALPVLFVLSLAMSACDRAPDPQQDLEALDRELADNRAARDPMAASAINDPIMVDPALSQSSNVNAIRPPDRPRSGALPDEAIAARAVTARPGKLDPAPPAGECPSCAAKRASLTLGALAARQRDGGVVRCSAGLRYSATWSTRLPVALPLYPDARIAEAAGVDGDGCRLRAVSYASGAPVQQVIDWYYTQARRGGYSAAHEAQGVDHVVGGTKGDDAYIVYVSPRPGGGSSVDMVANGGR